MVRSVHICTVGSKLEPSIAVIGSGLQIDKLYLLNSKTDYIYNDVERGIYSTFKAAGILDIETVVIDPFEYQSTVDAIIRIESKERRENPKVRFYINFTSGTNIMAAAACNTSFFIDSVLYYIMNTNTHPGLPKDEIVKIIIAPKIPDMNKIKGLTIDVLKRISEKEEGISNYAMLSAMKDCSPSKVGYHTKILETYGLIEKKREGRGTILKITNSGKMTVRWLA